MNIIFRSSLFSIHSKYLLYSYRNYLTDLSQYTNSLSHPYIQQNNRRFSIVFFPNYFSMQNEKKFCWEWFFILLRRILRAAASDFMPCTTSPTHTMRLNEKRVHILHTIYGSIHYGELSSLQPSPVLHGDASVSAWAPKSHRTVWARRESIHWKKVLFPPNSLPSSLSLLSRK